MYWNVLECTRMYWSLLECTGVYWSVLECTRMRYLLPIGLTSCSGSGMWEMDGKNIMEDNEFKPTKERININVNVNGNGNNQSSLKELHCLLFGGSGMFTSKIF